MMESVEKQMEECHIAIVQLPMKEQLVNFAKVSKLVYHRVYKIMLK